MEAFSVNPASTRGVNADGSVNVKCKICGNFICRMMYRGFTTSVCSACQGKPIPVVQETPAAVLYQDEPSSEKLGLKKAVFRALGFGKRREPKPKSDESTAVVRDKKRKPLFGPEDK